MLRSGFRALSISLLALAFVPLSFAGTPADVSFTETIYASPGGAVTSLAWATDGSSTLFGRTSSCVTWFTKVIIVAIAVLKLKDSVSLVTF